MLLPVKKTQVKVWTQGDIKEMRIIKIFFNNSQGIINFFFQVRKFLNCFVVKRSFTGINLLIVIVYC